VPEFVKTRVYKLQYVRASRVRRIVPIVKLTDTERFNGLTMAFDYNLFARKHRAFHLQQLEEIRSVLHCDTIDFKHISNAEPAYRDANG
jgi:hypothetical protein